MRRCVSVHKVKNGPLSLVDRLMIDGWSESHKQARDALEAFTSVNAISDQQTTAAPLRHGCILSPFPFCTFYMAHT